MPAPIRPGDTDGIDRGQRVYLKKKNSKKKKKKSIYPPYLLDN